MNANRSLINFINVSVFDSDVSTDCLSTDYAAVFSAARQNAICSIVFNGIRKVSASKGDKLEPMFRKELDKSLFMFAMQTQQLAEISMVLEQAKIPFVLLKGSRMREMYPSPELRTSCDIDILARADDARLIELMEGIGMTFDRDGGTTMNFRKGIAIELELHRCLFDKKLSFSVYFDDIWDRVKPVDGWLYQYQMTEEDFFANMIAHYAKHFSRYGSGIRSALDIAVYLKNAPAEFDLAKAEQILKDIGLYGFEQKLLHLIRAWQTDQWEADDDLLTDYILGCGVFGSEKTRMTHAAVASDGKKSKSRYFWFHVFPNLNTMCNLYPVLKKCPILLPFCWIARILRLIFTDSGKVKKVIKQQSEFDDDAISTTNDVIRKMHLEYVGVGLADEQDCK